MRYEPSWSDKALADVRRLHAFLHDKSPAAASAALDTILLAVFEISNFPSIGRPLSDEEADYRELPVPFSNSGYVVLYKFDGTILEIQSIRHMREAGY